MKKCLFLLCLCLVPFVVVSSTTFTSQNPIELPSGNSVPVLDTKGNPLDPRLSYRIVSVFWGALGGGVYLGRSPNSSAPCDNGVFIGAPGTPVGFVGPSLVPRPPLRPGIFENQDMNILFTILVAPECVRYRIWKVGDYDVSVGARLLETGGTVREEGSSWFRIVRAPALGYNIFYCPGPFVCPSCPLDQCRQAVGVVIQNRKRRLALVNDHPLAVNFAKV